jgi:AcrR family transcriptional regulator
MIRTMRANEPDAARPDPGDGDIPQPPWLRPRREPEGRQRTPLTREAIVDAAMRVLDSEGVDALTMRRLGEELGTGPASLYWHVAGKEELLHLLIDRVTGEAKLPVPDPSRWREQLKELGQQMREIFKRHRDIAKVSLGRVPVGPNLVITMEWWFSLLRGARLPDRVVAYAADALALYVGAFAYEESLSAFLPGADPEHAEEMVGQFRDYLASMPAERFPNVVALADMATSGGVDERFEFGLDMFIAGLAAQIPKD